MEIISSCFEYFYKKRKERERGAKITIHFNHTEEMNENMKLYKLLSLIVSLSLIISLLPKSVSAEVLDNDFVEVEAAPVDPTISLEGPRHKIDFVDESLDGKSDFIALFTEEFAKEILVKKFWVAVQVDQNNRVLKVVSQSNNGSVPIPYSL